jgi:plastocyanin
MTSLLSPALAAVIFIAANLAPTNANPAAGSTAGTPGQTIAVSIDNYAFKDPTITVTTGTTVVWKNLDDDPHTVTAINGLFDSKGLAQGDTFAYRFTTPGSYAYYCKVHPMMRGTVIVKESGS